MFQENSKSSKLVEASISRELERAGNKSPSEKKKDGCLTKKLNSERYSFASSGVKFTDISISSIIASLTYWSDIVLTKLSPNLQFG